MRLIAAETELLKLLEEYHLSLSDFEILVQIVTAELKSQPYMPSVSLTQDGIKNLELFTQQYNDTSTCRVRLGSNPFPDVLQDSPSCQLAKQYWENNKI